MPKPFFIVIGTLVFLGLPGELSLLLLLACVALSVGVLVLSEPQPGVKETHQALARTRTVLGELEASAPPAHSA